MKDKVNVCMNIIFLMNDCYDYDNETDLNDWKMMTDFLGLDSIECLELKR